MRKRKKRGADRDNVALTFSARSTQRLHETASARRRAQAYLQQAVLSLGDGGSIGSGSLFGRWTVRSPWRSGGSRVWSSTGGNGGGDRC